MTEKEEQLQFMEKTIERCVNYFTGSLIDKNTVEDVQKSVSKVIKNGWPYGYGDAPDVKVLITGPTIRVIFLDPATQEEVRLIDLLGITSQ